MAPRSLVSRAGAGRLRIALEATSLLGARTGVGSMTRAVLERLAPRDDLEITAVLVSWRGRGRLAVELPPGVGQRSLTFPARLAHLAWQRLDHPALRRFDVVHGPNFVVPPAAGRPELVTIHDLGPWRYPELVSQHSRAYPELLTRALGRGAHVHVVSAFVGAEVRELIGVSDDRVHVIRNGFAAPGASDRGDPAAGRRAVGGPYVLALGTIEPRKDLPTLVDAMAEIWPDHPELRLAHVGADGWGSEAFEAAVARSGGGERIVRLGYVSDSQRSDLLAGAELLAFPSVYEGFGLPPLEAMARGTPVVTTTAGALPEVCGDAAVLVEPGDPSALAAAIVEVLADDEVRQRLVTAGQERAGAFSWDSSATELAALYHRLADRP